MIAQYAPLREPITDKNGKITPLWEKYFTNVLQPYLTKVIDHDQEIVSSFTDFSNKDNKKQITNLEKLLYEVWQTNDKGLNKRIEDVENALKFIDGPKDASLLKRLDELEKLIFSFPRVIERSPGSHIADASIAHTITDPGDAPATADALRDDLVANAIPEIETALNALGTTVNEILTRMEKQGQNHSG